MKPSRCGFNGVVSCQYCRNYLKKGFCSCPSSHEPYPKETELYCAGFQRSERFYELLEEEKKHEEEQKKIKQLELF